MTYKYVDTNLCNHTDQIMDIWAARRTEKMYFPDSALSGKITKDTLEKSTDKKTKATTSEDGNDDGKISLKEKLKNFGKGLVAPIKSIFSSPKNMAITAASVIGGAALIAATGGAAAPVMVAAGLIGGGVQIGKGIYKQVNAKTDDEAKQAWQQMGSGTFTVGVSAASAKTSLKAAKVDGAKDMSTMKAVGKCIVDLPKNIKTSVKNISSKVSPTPVVNTTTETKTSAVADSKPVVDTASQPEPASVKPVDATPETAPAETSASGKPVDVIPETPLNSDIMPDGLPDTPPETLSVPSNTTETIIEPKVVNEQVVVPKSDVKTPIHFESSQNNQLALPSPEKRLALPEPQKRLLLESKTTSTPEKLGIIARIKKFLNVFGLFLPKNK